MKIHGKKAKDYIDTDLVVTHPEDSIVDLLETVKNDKISYIPVVDKQNKLVGLITRSILLTSLSQQFIGDESL